MDKRPLSPTKPAGPPDKTDHHHLRGGHANPKGTNRHHKAKKGGAGKGAWGKPGDEMRDLKQDHDDPNYDSADDEEGVDLSVADYPIELSDIKDIFEPLVKEYFTNGDASEVLLECDQVTLGGNAYYLCELVIRLGLERTVC
jgi:hypothetical protein